MYCFQIRDLKTSEIMKVYEKKLQMMAVRLIVAW